MDNDYIILFDENGSPYIAHAFGDRLRSAATSVGNAATSAYGNTKAGVGRGTRATHKYIDKIVENGRTRYFYTQEELKAYYNEKAKPAINKATQNARAAASRAATAVGDTASNVAAKGRMVTNQAGEAARNLAANGKTVAGNAVNRAGETARNVAQNARSARSEATRRAEEALQRGKSSTAQMRTEFRNKAEQAGRSVKNVTSSVKDTIKDIAGVDERQRRDSARKDYETASKTVRNVHEGISEALESGDNDKFNRAIENRDTAYRNQDNARDTLNKAQSEYDKTPLGMVDKAKEKIRFAKNDIEVALYRGSESINKTTENVKKMADKALFEIEYAAKRAINDFTGNKDKATRDWYAQALETAKNEAKGAGESKKFYYDYVISNLEKKVSDADKRYRSSTVQQAKTNITSAYEEASKKGKEALDSASTIAKNAAAKGKTAVESASGSARAAIQNGTAKAEDYAKAAHEIATSVVSATKDKAGSAINALSNSLGGFIKGIKVSGNNLSLPGGKTITIPEKYISENVIPESYITETIIPEIIEYEHTLHERRG